MRGSVFAFSSFALALGLAAAASAQTEGGPLGHPRIAEVRSQVEARLEAARQGGFPEELLLQKVAEGLAKGAAPSQIALAVERLLSRFQVAERILGRALPNAADPSGERRRLLSVTADALGAGAPEKALEALAREIGRSGGVRDRRTMRDAMALIAELGERGIDGDVAVEATARAFRRAGASGFAQILVTVRSLPPGASAAERRAALSGAAEGRPPSGRGLERGAEPPGPPSGVPGRTKGRAR